MMISFLNGPPGWFSGQYWGHFWAKENLLNCFPGYYTWSCDSIHFFCMKNGCLDPVPRGALVWNWSDNHHASILSRPTHAQRNFNQCSSIYCLQPKLPMVRENEKGGSAFNEQTPHTPPLVRRPRNSGKGLVLGDYYTPA